MDGDDQDHLLHREATETQHLIHGVHQRPRSRSAHAYQLPISQFMFWIAASFCYIMGGYCFLPESEYYATGAAWFGIGSIAVLTSDCMDWWLTQHGHYSSSSSMSRNNDLMTPFPFAHLLDNHGLQLNILLSIFSTVLLFIGAMLLIEASTLTIGLWFFIIGTMISMISQVWKAIRSRVTLKNLWREAGNAVFSIDVAVLIFNVGILIGDASFFFAALFTWLAFADSITLSDDLCLTMAGSCFMLAGIFYLLSVTALWCLLAHY
jgi:hypothetical protein